MQLVSKKYEWNLHYGSFTKDKHKQNINFLQQFWAFRYFSIVEVSEIKQKNALKNICTSANGLELYSISCCSAFLSSCIQSRS